MKVLSISDIPEQIIYSPHVRSRFSDVDLVIACGDLPYYYQEYIISMLDVPLFFVRGNHDKKVEYNQHGPLTAPRGAIDLHRRVLQHAVQQGPAVQQKWLLLAGVEGSLRYRPGPFQYSQQEMWFHVLALVPGMLRNWLSHRRYLDIFVTHAPPRGVHDLPDLPHRGINAFRWLIRVFKPAYHFHGHIHVYRPDTITETRLKNTRVINTFGFRETILECQPQRQMSIGR